jgi:hypothetical protein
MNAFRFFLFKNTIVPKRAFPINKVDFALNLYLDAYEDDGIL